MTDRIFLADIAQCNPVLAKLPIARDLAESLKVLLHRTLPCSAPIEGMLYSFNTRPYRYWKVAVSGEMVWPMKIEVEMRTQLLQIDIYTDLNCPWCLIGLSRLDRVLAELSQTFTTVIRHHPRILDPKVHEWGALIREKLLEKHGITPEAAFPPAEAQARASGLALDLSKQQWSYPTAAGHSLIRHAAPKNQHALARELLESYFLEARNIASPDVLVDIADRHGLGEAKVREILSDPREKAATQAASDRAAAQGVNVVPTFVLNGRLRSGGLPEAQLKTLLLDVVATT